MDAVMNASVGGAIFFGTMAFYLAQVFREATVGFVLLWLILGAGLGVAEWWIARAVTAIMVGVFGGLVDKRALGEVLGRYWFIVGAMTLLSLPFAGSWVSRYLIGTGLVVGLLYSAFGASQSSGLSYARGLLAVGFLFAFVPLLFF